MSNWFRTIVAPAIGIGGQDPEWRRQQNWKERRLRLAMRRYGSLRPEVIRAEVKRQREKEALVGQGDQRPAEDLVDPINLKEDEDEVDGIIETSIASSKTSLSKYVKELIFLIRTRRRVSSPSRQRSLSRSRSFPPQFETDPGEPIPLEEDEPRVPPSPQRLPALKDVTDNSDRRVYGIGILGKILNRGVDKQAVKLPHVRYQLNDLTDYRPFFSYWVSFVQIVILLISLLSYGFAPFGAGLSQRSGLVLTERLALEQVDLKVPYNFWLGPKAGDLVHLGAKYSPCMRRDPKIMSKIEEDHEIEIRDTGCCVRNDHSGCVQTTKDSCSPLLSNFLKWSDMKPHERPGGRLSGPVCGQDPNFCVMGASEWPDNIGKWPICQTLRDVSLGGPQHMNCEVLAKPCCYGIHGKCELKSQEFCNFVQGTFHPEASLCSQVSCMGDVCGMLPFVHKDVPDQFYRLWTSLFLTAGLIHLAIVVFIQVYLMRDLERMCGPIRLALIYFGSGIIGNLASAVFVPYRAECGPAGSLFGVLAALTVEVFKAWDILQDPVRAVFQFVVIMTGFLVVGLVPWVDNYAHFFGFVAGLLISHALFPSIDVYGVKEEEETVEKQPLQLLGKWLPVVCLATMVLVLILLFYLVPFEECEWCKWLSCVPIVSDFCAEQNINFVKKAGIF